MREMLLAQVQRTIAAHGLLIRGSRLLIAVSGGADSVALLRLIMLLLPAWKLSVHVGHLDHALRSASQEDAEFVRSLARRWHLPVTVKRVNVRSECARQGWSLEDGARRLRYEFLLETAQRFNASYVLTAHTADDQAETVLMRLVRGTGLMGLSAIPAKRRMDDVWVVRPLLECWRLDILELLREEGLTFRVDETNVDQRFVRNRIRQELLPLLEQGYNPKIKASLTQLAAQSASDYAFLQEAAGRQWKRMVTRVDASGLSLGVAVFRRQPKAIQRQLVRRAVQQVRGDLGRFEYRHWLEVERLFGERPVGTVVDLPGGVQLRRERERVVCRRAEHEAMIPYSE